MELTRDFHQISKGDAGIAGGKGASLGEMTQAGIPVPHGFVILASAFQQFLEEADLNQEIDSILHAVNREEMRSVEHASEKIQDRILRAKMPEDIGSSILQNYKTLGAEYVAVRSSATAEDSSSAAWAGQLDTFLNTTEDNLLENVQKCWASLFTPRAIFYRFEKGMHDKKISVAVVVQKMIQSEVSGVAFSVHPVTEDRNQMIIEAGFGLGEAIVSGQVTPDSFVVEKNPRRIIDKNISYQPRALWRAKDGGNEWRQMSQEEGSKPTLSDTQVLGLSETILAIEKHYGFPCDIEWAFEAGHFFITQSRPITTLSASSEFSPRQNILDVDWELWIRRPDQPPFFNSMWMEIEGPLLAEAIGGGFTKQLCLRYGDDNLWIRSTSDFDTVRQNIRSFINERSDVEIEQLFKKANNKADEVAKLMSEIHAYSDKKLLEKFDEIISNLNQILLYTTSVPWFLLDMIEHTESSTLKHYEYVKNQAEQLRARSFYREIKTAALDRISLVIAEKFSLETGLVQSLTVPEIRQTLQKNVLAIDARELSDRETCAYWDVGEGIVFTTDWRVMDDIKRKINFGVSGNEAQTVKGSVAFAGIVTGKVKLLFSESDMGKIQLGDILVSPSTNPALMPAMILCGAIVTDEGGIGSHAAIVARELKKPCVIGTKIATHVFKDGDMVEVDANVGIVRKLDI